MEGKEGERAELLHPLSPQGEKTTLTTLESTLLFDSVSDPSVVIFIFYFAFNLFFVFVLWFSPLLGGACRHGELGNRLPWRLPEIRGR